VLVERLSDLQSTDERERRCLTTVGDLGELILEEVDVGLEAVFRSHPDEEEVVTTLGFLASGVLCEEGLSDLREVERTWWQGVDHSDAASLRLEGKHYRIVAGVWHHLILKVADVLNRIARSGIAVKGGSREFPRKLTFLDVFGKRGVGEGVVGIRC